MVAEKAAEMIREEEGDGVSWARQPG
jgi:hypothetical protein